MLNNNNNDNDAIAMELLAHAIEVCKCSGGYFDETGRPYHGPDPWRAPGVRYVSRRSQLLAALGIDCDGAHIPPEATAEGYVDGVLYVVEPGVVGAACDKWPRRDGKPRRHNSARHRVFVFCPVCGKRVPVGRLHQHAIVHGPERYVVTPAVPGETSIADVESAHKSRQAARRVARLRGMSVLYVDGVTEPGRRAPRAGDCLTIITRPRSWPFCDAPRKAG